MKFPPPILEIFCFSKSLDTLTTRATWRVLRYYLLYSRRMRANDGN